MENKFIYFANIGNFADIRFITRSASFIVRQVYVREQQMFLDRQHVASSGNPDKTIIVCDFFGDDY